MKIFLNLNRECTGARLFSCVVILMATILGTPQNALAAGQFVKPSEFTNEFPADAKIINVTNWSTDPTQNVTPNDGVDDTARLQYIFDRFRNVSDDNQAAQHMIYLPAGIYDISNTLVTVRDSHYFGRPKIVGHSATSTILKLKDNATGFAAGQNKAVIQIGLTSNMSFASYFTDMGVDVGSGNPGAVGIQFIGHNYAALQRVKIVAPPNSGSIGLALGNLPQKSGYMGVGPHLTSDVTINGFATGVYVSGDGMVVLERFTLSDQRSEGVRNRGSQTPVGLRDVTSIQSGAVPAYLGTDPYSPAPLSLNGCHFINTSGGTSTPAVDLISTGNPARLSTWHIKGVIQSGYASMLRENNVTLISASTVSELQQTKRSESSATGPRMTTALQNPLSPDLDVPDSPLYINHNFGSDYIAAGPGDSQGAGTGDDAAFRAALSSGKKVIYMPTHGPTSDLNDANDLRLQGSYTIPSSVEALDFFYQSLYLTNSVKFIIGGTASDPPLVIRRFEISANFWPGSPNARNFAFEHQGGRTVVIEDLAADYDALPGAGNVFMNNVVPSRIHTAAGQKIWARQLDQEQSYSVFGNGPNVPFLTVDGSTMWISNWKTETARPICRLLNGAVLEASILKSGNPDYDPTAGKWVLDTVDSTGSIAAMLTDSAYHVAFGDLIREKRGSVTNTYIVPNPNTPIDGLAHGLIISNPVQGNQPPTPVLASGTVTANAVSLNWGDVSGETGYLLEYATNPAFSQNLVKITLAVNATSRTVTGLSPNTAFYFRLRANNGSVYSARSAPVTVTTTNGGQPPAPAAPSALAAAATSQTQINLSWADNSSNELGFKIERKVGSGGSWSQIATPTANSTSHVDGGLSASTNYVYRIRATSASGDSAFSAEANATTSGPQGLPSSGVAPTAVATFHNMSLYWNPPGASAASVCKVRYRKVSEPSNFRLAQDLFYDSANSRYSGSVVNLEQGVPYVFELTRGTSALDTVTASTWGGDFPVKQTVVLPASVPATYLITQGGNANDGYVVYDGTANSTVIDADPSGGSEGDAANYCVEIRASYVILRGVVAKNAKMHGIYLNSNLHDVIIEGCDITNWGRKNAWAGKTVRVAYKNYITGNVETSTETRTVLANLGKQLDSGIRGKGNTMERIIIQGNKIHHPRYNSNNWTQPSGDYFARNVSQSIADFHPEGPKAIVLYEPGVDVPTKGNHVIRYNDIYGDSSHRFNDAIFESYGNVPYAVDCPFDTDIYGNYIADVVDDIMETERAICNVRVYGNYFTNISKGVSFYQSASAGGPFYMFRNVFDLVQQTSRPGFSYSVVGTDLRAQIMKRPYMPTGGQLVPYSNSRLFIYHNTYLAPADQGYTFMWGNDIPNMTPYSFTGALVSRNNIYKTSANWPTSSGTGLPAPNAPMMTFQSAGVTSGPTPYDGDVYNGNVESAASAAFGAHCVKGLAVYQAGNGVGSSGKYQLQSGSLGFDGGVVLPNFNDGFSGTAPDSGVQEDGSGDMIFGVANWSTNTTIPAAPSAFAATANSQTQVNLIWTDNSSNETGFKIERKTGAGGTWAQITTPAANATSYSDSGLTASTNYVYRIRATSTAGDSSYSPEASATTSSPPGGGTTLTSAAGADAHVNSQSPTTNYGTNVAVSVQKSASRNFESYFRFDLTGINGTVTGATLRLKESPTGTSSNDNVPMSVRAITGTWTESGVTWNNKPAYAATSLGSVAANSIANDQVINIVLNASHFTGNGIYNLALIGTADGNDTPFISREAGNDAPQLVLTIDPSPTAPSGLSASAISSSRIDLTWTDTASNETGFEIQRKTGAGGTWALIASVGTNITTYQNNSLSAETLYYYRVRAIGTGGSSGYSGEASAMTQAANTSVVITTNVAADAQVNSDYPTTNFGSIVEVSVQKSTGRNFESYFRFAVSGVVGTVTSAKLRVKESPTGTSSSNNVPMSVRQITGAWTEGGVTWNTKPAYAGASLGTVPANTIANDDVVDMDLDPAHFTGDGTYQLALIGTANGGDTPFMSREAGTNSPQLILTVLSAPIAPSNLSAIAASSSAINLTWTDNSINETGFEVQRKTGASGTWALIASPASNATSYQSTGLNQATVYYYRVRAIGTGGASSYSAESAAATTGSLEFFASADTYVNSTTVSTNYGSELYLGVQKSSSRDMESYLRFDLSGVTGTVTGAKLRLKESPTGTSSLDNGAMSVRAITGSWTESTATWSNRPAYSNTSLGTVPALSISNDALVEIDLDPSHFAGNGVYDLALIGTSNGNDTPFVSRENGSNQPQLVLTIGSDGPPMAAKTLVVPAGWRDGFDLSSDGSDDLAQPAGDGICNLLKIALNLADGVEGLQESSTHHLSDPDGTTAEEVGGMPSFYIDAEGCGVLSFIRRSDASSIGLQYVVEWGDSLGHMSASSEAIEEVLPLTDPWERVHCKDSFTNGDGNHRFARLRVVAE